MNFGNFRLHLDPKTVGSLPGWKADSTRASITVQGKTWTATWDPQSNSWVIDLGPMFHEYDIALNIATDDWSNTDCPISFLWRLTTLHADTPQNVKFGRYLIDREEAITIHVIVTPQDYEEGGVVFRRITLYAWVVVTDLDNYKPPLEMPHTIRAVIDNILEGLERPLASLS